MSVGVASRRTGKARIRAIEIYGYRTPDLYAEFLDRATAVQAFQAALAA